MSDLKPRQPAGIPIGGQYAAYRHDEPGTVLTRDVNQDRRTMAERRELLRSAGFIPASTLQATVMPSTTENREDWWDRNMVAAEYRTPGKGYPQMPDDYTPARTLGQAMSGHRRTHRMNYRNQDISVRMPSATAVKRYSAENGNPTFDVPVSVSVRNGAPRQGWVRVTKTGPHSWEATALGGDGDSADRISEAVACVLEDRRPSVALRRVPDLLAKHRQREAAKGTELAPVSSSFIDEIGYEEETHTMATRIGNKLYGHKVSKDLFNAVKNADRPGAVFNKIIKSNPGAGVEKCPNCGRFHSAVVAHTCPKSHKPESGIGQDYIERARQHARTAAAVRSHGVQAPSAAKVVAAPAPVNTAPSPHAQPVPAKAAALKPADPSAPAHLRNPIRSQAAFTQELWDLKARARQDSFDITADGVGSVCEASTSTGDYTARITANADGTLNRFVDGKPVKEFDAGHRKAQQLEQWATRNALGMARITEAEQEKRRVREARASAQQ